MSNIFEELSAIDVSKKLDKKKDLSYLSWTFAIEEISRRYPDFKYEICKFDNGNGVMLPYMYDFNTGYICQTRVTINGDTKEMWLPVMDSGNHAMKSTEYDISTKYSVVHVPAATMFDVNKTLMRCLVKNLAMFGLGIGVYQGEDLPEDDKTTDEDLKKFEKAATAEKTKETKAINKAIKNGETELPKKTVNLDDLKQKCTETENGLNKCDDWNKLSTTQKDYVNNMIKALRDNGLNVESIRIEKKVRKLQGLDDDFIPDMGAENVNTESESSEG